MIAHTSKYNVDDVNLLHSLYLYVNKYAKYQNRNEISAEQLINELSAWINKKYSKEDVCSFVSSDKKISKNEKNIIEKIREECKCFVYVIKDPITNNVVYVGQTNNPKSRKKSHFQCRDKSNKAKNEWIKNKLRSGNEPIFEVIETCNYNTITNRERYWINFYNKNNDLLNIQFVKTNSNGGLA